MTKGEKMVENVKKQFEEINNAREPVSEEEEFTICGMQIDKNNVRQLEVQNSQSANITNLNTPIPAKDYDLREQNKKQEGSTRE